MSGLILEGVNEIVQKVLGEMDLVSKDDIRDLLKDNFSSEIWMDKKELYEIIADSLDEFKVTLKGYIQKTVAEDLEVMKNGVSRNERATTHGQKQQKFVVKDKSVPAYDQNQQKFQNSTMKTSNQNWLKHW